VEAIGAGVKHFTQGDAVIGGKSSGDRSARLWDLSALPSEQLGGSPVVIDQPILTLTGHNSDVWNGVFSPDGSTLATISFDGTAKL
jgi:WD40 repeat protein